MPRTLLRMRWSGGFAEAEKHNCDTIWLGVWEFNPRAQAFYRKHGFYEVGKHIFQLGADAQTDVLMQKDLQDL